MPFALDLFCGGGGAALGIQKAGFDVVGIDIKIHKNYPGDFIQADALKPPVQLSDFSLIWASPPCQRWSLGTNCRKQNKKHPDMIPAVRELLKGHPFTCIENVPQAPIRPDVLLVGEMFGLHELWRKRAFEVSFWCWQPTMPKFTRKQGTYKTIVGNMGCNQQFYDRKARGLPGSLSKAEAKASMGIPLDFPMTRREIVESVPPAYAEYIASQARRLMHEKTEKKENNGNFDNVW